MSLGFQWSVSWKSPEEPSGLLCKLWVQPPPGDAPPRPASPQASLWRPVSTRSLGVYSIPLTFPFELPSSSLLRVTCTTLPSI